MINWENILQTSIALISVATITGFGSLCYRHRKQLASWIKKCRLKYFPVKFNVALSIEYDKKLNSGKYFKEIEGLKLENWTKSSKV